MGSTHIFPSGRQTRFLHGPKLDSPKRATEEEHQGVQVQVDGCRLSSSSFLLPETTYTKQRTMDMGWMGWGFSHLQSADSILHFYMTESLCTAFMSKMMGKRQEGGLVNHLTRGY